MKKITILLFALLITNFSFSQTNKKVYSNSKKIRINEIIVKIGNPKLAEENHKKNPIEFSIENGKEDSTYLCIALLDSVLTHFTLKKDAYKLLSFNSTISNLSVVNHNVNVNDETKYYKRKVKGDLIQNQIEISNLFIHYLTNGEIEKCVLLMDLSVFPGKDQKEQLTSILNQYFKAMIELDKIVYENNSCSKQNQTNFCVFSYKVFIKGNNTSTQVKTTFKKNSLKIIGFQ